MLARQKEERRGRERKRGQLWGRWREKKEEGGKQASDDDGVVVSLNFFSLLIDQSWLRRESSSRRSSAPSSASPRDARSLTRSGKRSVWLSCMLLGREEEDEVLGDLVLPSSMAHRFDDDDDDV